MEVSVCDASTCKHNRYHKSSCSSLILFFPETGVCLLLFIAHTLFCLSDLQERLETAQVTAIVDQNSDGVAESACVLLDNLNNPEGLVWLNGSIYVATVTTVARYDNADSAALKNCTVWADLLSLPAWVRNN